MDNIGSIADRAVVVKEEIERINQKEWKRKSGSALDKKIYSSNHRRDGTDETSDQVHAVNKKVSESEEENENLELVASRVLRNLRKSEEALIKKFPFLSCPASEVRDFGNEEIGEETFTQTLSRSSRLEKKLLSQSSFDSTEAGEGISSSTRKKAVVLDSKKTKKKAMEHPPFVACSSVPIASVSTQTKKKRLTNSPFVASSAVSHSLRSMYQNDD